MVHHLRGQNEGEVEKVTVPAVLQVGHSGDDMKSI